MGVSSVCMSVPDAHRYTIRSPGPGLTDSCELPCGCWKLNLGPLQEQQVLLTVTTWSFKGRVDCFKHWCGMESSQSLNSLPREHQGPVHHVQTSPGIRWWGCHLHLIVSCLVQSAETLRVCPQHIWPIPAAHWQFAPQSFLMFC